MRVVFPIFVLIVLLFNSCLWNYRENIKTTGAMKEYFEIYDELYKKLNLKVIDDEVLVANKSTDSTKIKAVMSKIKPLSESICQTINSRITSKSPLKFTQTGNFDKYKIEQVLLTKVMPSTSNSGIIVPDLVIEVKCTLLKKMDLFEEIRFELVNTRNRPYMSLYEAPDAKGMVSFKIPLHKDNKEFDYLNIQ